MIWLVIKKEFLASIRDTRLQVSGGILIILMLTAIFSRQARAEADSK